MGYGGRLGSLQRLEEGYVIRQINGEFPVESGQIEGNTLLQRRRLKSGLLRQWHLPLFTP